MGQLSFHDPSKKKEINMYMIVSTLYIDYPNVFLGQLSSFINLYSAMGSIQGGKSLNVGPITQRIPFSC